MNYFEEQYYEPSMYEEVILECVGKMKEILLGTIKTEMENIKNENISLKELNKELNQKIYDLPKRERELEKNKEKIIAEAEDNVRRLIYGGFCVGDKVWIKKNIGKYTPCKQCNGTEKLTAIIENEPMEVTCPKCKGNGQIYNCEHEPDEGFISQITFEEWNGNKSNKLEVWVKCNRCDSDKYSLNEIYKTFEECKSSKKQG